MRTKTRPALAMLSTGEEQWLKPERSFRLDHQLKLVANKTMIGNGEFHAQLKRRLLVTSHRRVICTRPIPRSLARL
jgi:hypothetical protein